MSVGGGGSSESGQDDISRRQVDPDVPPYDAPTEVFAAVPHDDAESGDAQQEAADGSGSEETAADSTTDDSDSADTEVFEVSDEATSGEAAEVPSVDESGAETAPVTAEEVVAAAPAAEPIGADAQAEDEPSESGSADPAETPTTIVDTSGQRVPEESASADASTTSSSTSSPTSDESPTIANPIVEPLPESASAPQPMAPSEPTAFASPPVVHEVAPAGGDGEPPTPGGTPWKKIGLVAGAAVAVLAVLYAADWAASSDRVPRGVTVAGIEVGGQAHSDAEQTLRSELGPRVEQPVQVDVGDSSVDIVPAAAGLDVDWNATLDRAGSQPINPITRLTSFFASREIGVVSTADPAALGAAVDGLRAETDREPVEGDVVFDAATPVAISPQPGRNLDVDASSIALQENWANGSVDAVYDETPVTVTQDAVDQALETVAQPAVSAPVVIAGREDTDATLTPDRVGEVLRFDPDGEGGLTPIYDTDAAIGILAPQLVSTERQPQDASFTFSGGSPTVVPGVTGELVEWQRTLEPLPTLLSADGSRTAEAVYAPAEPDLTTEAAEALGVQEVIGEYTTGGFEYASGVNIGLTAQIVNGALVRPGDTFSLNEYTGPRGFAQGFVESGIIDNGRPDRAVGGGISQFATTLYNASYFAGMEDTEHTEHSYYISRYPEAREATVFEGAIDLKFTNPTRTGVLVQSFANSSSVTVRLWGTKTVDVQSITGPRTNPTSPDTVELPAGSGCVASSGGPGFTASDTRVITDIASGNVISRNTRTVRYDPIPIVRCIEPDRPEPAAAASREPARGEPTRSTPEPEDSDTNDG